MGRILGWMLAGIAEVAALMWIAARAPDRLRLVGLFSIGLALLAGWGLGLSAGLAGIRLPGLVFVISTIILGCGQMLYIGTCYTSYGRALRQESERLKAQFQSDPAANMVAEFQKDKGADDDPEARRAREGLRLELERIESARTLRLQELQRVSFPDYLKYRISPLVSWPQPWPLVFFGLELVCGSVSGGWLASAFIRRRPLCSSDGG